MKKILLMTFSFRLAFGQAYHMQTVLGIKDGSKSSRF